MEDTLVYAVFSIPPSWRSMPLEWYLQRGGAMGILPCHESGACGHPQEMITFQQVQILEPAHLCLGPTCLGCTMPQPPMWVKPLMVWGFPSWNMKYHLPPLEATNIICKAVEGCQWWGLTHMATSCGDPHSMMGSMLLRPRGLPIGLQHMRPEVGLQCYASITMFWYRHRGPGWGTKAHRHPGCHGPSSLPTREDLQSLGPWIWIPQALACSSTSHPTDPDVASLISGATSLKWPHDCQPTVPSATGSESAPSISFKYQICSMPKCDTHNFT